MLSLSDNDFWRLVNFVKTNYGIDLSKKKHLITSRLSNSLDAMGHKTFTSYIDYILQTKKQSDIELMLNKLTTNYTYFLRETEHFDYFKKTVLPYLRETKKDRVLSIWSAGCSSGEEPYTISMILYDFFGPEVSRWDTRVLATDISQNVLSRAYSATYPEDALKDVPPEWKRLYFNKTAGADFVVAPNIKKNVIFRTFNLMDPIKFKMKFDIIFCRNVMIYFDQNTKDALVNRFYNATNNGGYLFIGHSETLNRDVTKYKYIMPAVYRKS